MEVLRGRAEAKIDRLIAFARGDQSLVNSALALYNAGKVQDVVQYIREHRREPGRPIQNGLPRAAPNNPAR